MAAPDQWAALGTALNALPRIDRIGLWHLQEGVRGEYRVILYSGNPERSRITREYSTEQDSFSPPGEGSSPVAALRHALSRWGMTKGLPEVQGMAEAYDRLEAALGELTEALRHV